MDDYFSAYLEAHRKTLNSIPVDQLTTIVRLFRQTLDAGKNIFVFGNGGSAANASHFVTDLGKGSSDKTYRRFQCVSLNDNTSWMTAIANDYSYDDVFLRQLINLANPGDLIFTMSVSGNSPNIIKAVEWARKNSIYTVALVGGNKGKLAEISDSVVIIHDTHYGRVEDAHMGICHMIAYAFMEIPDLQTK
ncbi:MAG TPA: SIS domain-containing protein [Chryseosolibacter sp.]|nr:SIS domain-containing protein [Chryseosolibacter sp.]